MNKPQDKSDVQGKSARTRRGCLGRLGRAAMATMYRTTHCRAAYDEMITFSGSPSQPEGLASLGDSPLIVLSAGATFDETPEAVVTAIGRDVLAQVIQVSQELQQELVSLSTQGK
jgi:hypothetical protein